MIKDDWAFALLEDALVDWPNDENKPIAFTVNEPDSSTLFIQNQPNSEAVDTQMTDREQPQLDDDYGDLQSEFNETHIFGEDPDITLANGDPTPKPTMVKEQDCCDDPLCFRNIFHFQTVSNVA